MEAIRLITKSNLNETVGDRTINVAKLSLNSIDRPSYVEIRGTSTVELMFVYPYSKEAVEVISSKNGLYEVKYGKVSGRIKSVVSKQIPISDTDKFSLSKAIKANGTGVRFIRNVENQLDMVKSILAEIKRERT